MDKKEVLARARDALRALESGVELSVEERWACYEALQFYLDEHPGDQDEPWGPLEATYRLPFPSGEEIEVRAWNTLDGTVMNDVIIDSNVPKLFLLQNPTKGQVRKLVALLGAQEV